MTYTAAVHAHGRHVAVGYEIEVNWNDMDWRDKVLRPYLHKPASALAIARAVSPPGLDAGEIKAEPIPGGLALYSDEHPDLGMLVALADGNYTVPAAHVPRGLGPCRYASSAPRLFVVDVGDHCRSVAACNQAEAERWVTLDIGLDKAQRGSVGIEDAAAAAAVTRQYVYRVCEKTCYRGKISRQSFVDLLLRQYDRE